MIKGLRGATIWSEDLNNLLPFYRDVLGFKVGLQIDGFAVLHIRQHEPRHHVEQGHLQQDRAELHEGPAGVVRQAKTRPPGLGRHDQQQGRPDERRGVEAHAAARQ